MVDITIYKIVFIDNKSGRTLNKQNFKTNKFKQQYETRIFSIGFGCGCGRIRTV